MGDLIRMDSGDFPDKHEGFGVWDRLCVVENVGSLLSSPRWGGLTMCIVSRGGMIAPILGGQLLAIDVSFPVYASVVTFVIAGVCVLFLKEAEKQEGEETQRVVLH